jgi:hypothetical protein
VTHCAVPVATAFALVKHVTVDVISEPASWKAEQPDNNLRYSR